MDKWRNFFESSGQDIWTVIDKAIGVAAADFPQELRLRRDGLTERMYTAHLLHLQDHEEDVQPRGSDKTNATSGVYHRDEELEEENDDEPQQQRHRRDSDDAARGMIRDRDRLDDVRDTDLLAALDEWDQEGMYVKEIMNIKESIRDIDQPESDIMEQLNKLEDLNLSVELLQRTEIGKEVNVLRKHSSRRVRAFAKKIVRSWKDLVDEWVRTCQQPNPTAIGNDQSGVAEEEEGLPSPPLDEGALLAARTASLEMSQFFDFMDDDLSAAGSGPSPNSNNLSDDFGSQPDSRRKNDSTDQRYRAGSPPEDHDSRAQKGGAGIHKVDKHRPTAVESKPSHNNVRNSLTSANTFRKPPTSTNGSKPSDGNAVSNRPANGQSQEKPRADYSKKPDARPASNLTSKPKLETSKSGPAIKPKAAGEIDVSEKFLLAKRKLAEGYQQINEAKKQRTVQALDLTDLPKGGPKSARPPQAHHVKPGQNRGWMNGRR
ncbi:hypothetical protein R1sor_004221 [Riccia sorocarpa]|uniref:TFIIS N-terminal domain-containing protein n=1 Tax=Riccia sorocarpa TaxID=122646 RepID=A0ABD3H7T0_9MARC